MTKQTAKKVSALLLQMSGQLDASVRFVKEAETEDVTDCYKRAIGKIMGAIYFELLSQIDKEHPELAPRDLGG